MSFASGVETQRQTPARRCTCLTPTCPLSFIQASMFPNKSGDPTRYGLARPAPAPRPSLQSDIASDSPFRNMKDDSTSPQVGSSHNSIEVN